MLILIIVSTAIGIGIAADTVSQRMSRASNGHAPALALDQKPGPPRTLLVSGRVGHAPRAKTGQNS